MQRWKISFCDILSRQSITTLTTHSHRDTTPHRSNSNTRIECCTLFYNMKWLIIPALIFETFDLSICKMYDALNISCKQRKLDCVHLQNTALVSLFKGKNLVTPQFLIRQLLLSNRADNSSIWLDVEDIGFDLFTNLMELPQLCLSILTYLLTHLMIV